MKRFLPFLFLSGTLLTGEIWQILITALEFEAGDFEKTLQFIVNYGRDNDTVAAVAGMPLGARVGYEALSASLKEQLVITNREQMALNLPALAAELSGREVIEP